MKHILFLFVFLSSFLLENPIFAQQQRFPQPEFSNGHVQPGTITPMPRATGWEYVDVFVLFAMLSVASWFILKKRSRKGIFWLGIISILYFGFWKTGCVCSVGSIGNISLALFDNNYAVPISVVAFFVLPLLFALFFGRSFCSGVCFMGAVQELVIYKPIKVSPLVQKALGILPYIYLGLSILLAALGSDFIICRFDPFVSFFRFDGRLSMIIFGVLLILTGMFVSRPYCRFLCPYGVLLNWMSRIAFWRVTVTPSSCIECKLCENVCPVDAIQAPTKLVKAEDKRSGSKRLLLLILLLPVLMLAGGFISSRLYLPLASTHPTVQLAEEIAFEIKDGKRTNSQESNAFHAAGQTVDSLMKDAAAIQQKFYTGTWILGIVLGLIFGIGLINASKLKQRKDYEPDKGECVSCCRCYKYCPVDRFGNVDADFKV
jgi:NosR/NirI family transcriptional regulator, nitrous oxide reductase regulator